MAAVPAARAEELPALFEAVDAALSFIARRRQQSTFSSVRASVERAVGRAFSERHLAQLLGVLPLAYELHYLRAAKRSDDDERARRPMVLILELGRAASVECASVATVAERRAAFLSKLTELRAAHGDAVAPDWTGFPSATEAERARSKGVKRQRPAAAAEPAAAPPAPASVAAEPAPVAALAAAPVAAPAKKPRKKGLRGLPPGLLARVREREQRSEAVRGKDAVAGRKKRSTALSLPRLFDLLINQLRASKRSAYGLTDLATKLALSSPPSHPLTPKVVAQKLHALAAAAPEWCEVARSEHDRRPLFRTRERSAKKLMLAVPTVRARLMAGSVGAPAAAQQA